MKVLVTGACGFIGSHITQRLITEGHSVIALDNLSSGDLDNVKNLQSNNFFKFINTNVVDSYHYDVDYIFNFACPASPIQYQLNPVSTVETNVLGTLNALRLAKKNGITVLQASTSEVYGDPLVHPQSENYFGNVNPIGPRACYDEGKRVAETLCFDYFRQFGTMIKVVRIFNTYGPKMRFNDGRIISNFIYQALKGEPITIYGDGNQTRSFCYIDDLITGLMAIFNSSNKNSGPYNIGNPEEVKIIDIANLILEITNSKSRITHSPIPIDDPKKRQPDIAKIKSDYNWRPTISLTNGIIKTIEEFSNRLSQNTSSTLL